jgi:hypothetical protein
MIFITAMFLNLVNPDYEKTHHQIRWWLLPSVQSERRAGECSNKVKNNVILGLQPEGLTRESRPPFPRHWIPAFAGMTIVEFLDSHFRGNDNHENAGMVPNHRNTISILVILPDVSTKC